ncbi:MAG: hypothetical protein RJA70_3885, partial [Pseudomonadota bacterium]
MPATQLAMKLVPDTGTHVAEAQLLRLLQSEDAVQDNSRNLERRVYEQYATLVDRVVWKILGPDADHDDVVHDVFLEVFRSISRIREPEKLRQWVAAVAVHTTRKEMRRRRLRKWIPWTHEEDLRAVDHWAMYDDKKMAIGVYAILDLMPPAERIVLALRWFKQLGLDELAVVSGCSR